MGCRLQCFVRVVGRLVAGCYAARVSVSATTFWLITRSDLMLIMFFRAFHSSFVGFKWFLNRNGPQVILTDNLYRRSVCTVRLFLNNFNGHMRMC